MDYYIKGLALYFTLQIRFKKSRDAPQNEKQHSLKLRRYVARLIDLNEYLASSPGVNLADEIYATEFKETILNSMNNSWSKQAYVQGFDCESILFKKAVNMFEWMDITESIYESVV